MSDPYYAAIRIIRRCQLETLVGLKRSTIYDKLNPKSPRYDPTFPKPIRLGGNSVGWVASEVEAWLQQQIQASRATSN
ncbi:MAG: AlpA family transcriptional regulator [Xanthomonadales bacterium]|nr:AlpA family transcriptional regulator [Xanthomonadales bacterium]MCB1640153.1 AlpA family transcriptional regulator [Xanthomonadales bacterium]